MITPTSAEALAEPVALIYRDAELRILSMIAEKLAQGLTLSGWEARQLTELQNVRREVLAILRETDAAAYAEIEQSIAWAYSGGELSALTDMDAELPAGVGLGPRPEVVALAGEVTAGVASATAAILRGVDDAYRRIVGQAAASVLAGTEGRRGATQRAIDAFLGQGLKFIPTKRGRMDIATYAEMAMRTATARGAIQGHLDQLGALGNDLVVIHPGPRACRICDQWARMILTTGTTTGPRLVESAISDALVTVDVGSTVELARAGGWGHPNCRCGMRGYIPGVTDPAIIERPEWDEAGYLAQQQQRAIERQIRAWKRREALAIDAENRADARRQVLAYQEKQREHIKRNPSLKRQSEREQIGGRYSGNPTQARRRAGTGPAPTPAASSVNGRDVRTMSDAERLEAARIMFGTNSPEYRKAKAEWG